MTQFSFAYIIRNFAALETMGDASRKDGKPFDSWGLSYLGEILRLNLNELRRLKTTRCYEGHVSISLRKLESTGVMVGVDRKSKFQSQKSGGHAGLPTVYLDVEVEIRDLQPIVLESLSTLIEEASQSNPVLLLEELGKDAEKTKYLSETDDFRTQLWKNRQKQMEKLEAGLGPLLKQLEKMGVPIDELKKLTPEKAFSLLPQVTTTLSQYDTTPRIMRQIAAQYLEIYKGIASKDKSAKCDVTAVETFGNDFYEIFRHCMNLLVRFLKYDQGQFWLEELEPGVDYFYIDTEVKMDGKGPLIPLSRHKHSIEMLDATFLLSEDEWVTIKKELQKYDVLIESRLSIGRIFTQAEIALVDTHFEAAIVIAHVAFEASMNRVLEYFFTEKIPHGFGRKVGLLQFILERASLAGLDSETYHDLWRLIDGKPKPNKRNPRKPWDYEDGLLPIRNNLQHRTEFPEISSKRVGEYISAARRLARHFDRWIQTEPPKDLADNCKEFLK